MGKIEKAVFDAGPLIHLDEISKVPLVEIVDNIFVPEEVYAEFKKHRDYIDVDIKKHPLSANAKEYSKTLMKDYYIDIGEAEAIALAKQKKINYFFTDDWDARDTALQLGLKAHGTLGIVMRAYRENMIYKDEAEEILGKLYDNSSLFITSKIVEKAVIEMNKFERRD